MAKKKTRGTRKKAKQRVMADAVGESEAGHGSEPEGDDHDHDHDHEHDDDHHHDEAQDADADADSDSDADADAGSPLAAKDRSGRKGRDQTRQRSAAVDPLIPSPDGAHVSSNGGLLFVGIIMGLMITAIIVQMLMGN